MCICLFSCNKSRLAKTLLLGHGWFVEAPNTLSCCRLKFFPLSIIRVPFPTGMELYFVPFIQLKWEFTHSRHQTIIKVCQRATIFYQHITILTVCEIIITQVCPASENIMNEYYSYILLGKAWLICSLFKDAVVTDDTFSPCVSHTVEGNAIICC